LWRGEANFAALWKLQRIAESRFGARDSGGHGCFFHGVQNQRLLFVAFDDPRDGTPHAPSAFEVER
jgi:hypothetical protein